MNLVLSLEKTRFNLNYTKDKIHLKLHSAHAPMTAHSKF